MCNILAILMPLLKMTVLLAHKHEFFRLIAYTQRRFWHENYDEYEKKIYMDCKRKCTIFVCFVIFTTKATLICYALSPILGKSLNLKLEFLLFYFFSKRAQKYLSVIYGRFRRLTELLLNFLQYYIFFT